MLSFVGQKLAPRLQQVRDRVPLELETFARKEADTLAVHIVAETRRAVDTAGRKQPRLTPAYARRAGRTERTLDRTGEMLRSVRVKKTGRLSYVVTVEGGRNQKIGGIHQARTPWFGPRPSYRRGVRDRFAEWGRTVLQKVTRR